MERIEYFVIVTESDDKPKKSENERRSFREALEKAVKETAVNQKVYKEYARRCPFCGHRIG